MWLARERVVAWASVLAPNRSITAQFSRAPTPVRRRRLRVARARRLGGAYSAWRTASEVCVAGGSWRSAEPGHARPQKLVSVRQDRPGQHETPSHCRSTDSSGAAAPTADHSHSLLWRDLCTLSCFRSRRTASFAVPRKVSNRDVSRLCCTHKGFNCCQRESNTGEYRPLSSSCC